jgi:hypothetical protein
MARPRSALTKFILSVPPGLSAKEVLAQVRAKGMRATEGNVYRVRRMFRPGKGTQTRPHAVASVSTAASAKLESIVIKSVSGHLTDKMKDTTRPWGRRSSVRVSGSCWRA